MSCRYSVPSSILHPPMSELALTIPGYPFRLTSGRRRPGSRSKRRCSAFTSAITRSSARRPSFDALPTARFPSSGNSECEQEYDFLAEVYAERTARRPAARPAPLPSNQSDEDNHHPSQGSKGRAGAGRAAAPRAASKPPRAAPARPRAARRELPARSQGRGRSEKRRNCAGCDGAWTKDEPPVQHDPRATASSPWPRAAS